MELSTLEPTVASAGQILDRILVPIDYSMDSHRAFGVALELQRVHGSVVRLFHAAESGASDDFQGGIGSPSVGNDWCTASEKRLRRFLDNVAPEVAGRIEVCARVGEPLFTIRAEIRSWAPTLLIVAARVHARVLRSPAERLVRDVTIPTLILPEL